MFDVADITAQLQGGPQPQYPAQAQPQSGPVSPAVASNQLLEIFRNLGANDPTRPNPATTEAMARSRDAVSKMLERSMRRIDSPFSGVQDILSAAEIAIRSQGQTPFGKTLEEMQQARLAKGAQIANTLSQVAQREARPPIDPLRAASIVQKMIADGERAGRKDETDLAMHVRSIASKMEPDDAIRFQTSYGKAIADYALTYGRNPTVDEQRQLIDQYARTGGFRGKQPGLQVYIDPITGARGVFNPSPYGSRPPPGQAAALPEGPIPTYAPPVRARADVAPPLTARPSGPPGQEPLLKTPTKIPLPEPARGVPPVVAKPALISIPETARRLDGILRAREAAVGTPQALGWSGAIIDRLGGFIQQMERAVGAPGAISEKMKVNEVSRARDTMNLLFGQLIPIVTGDTSGRYSNYDLQLAERMTRFRNSMASQEQAVGFFTILRDMEVRALRRAIIMAGPGGQSLLETLSPEVLTALQSPAVIGPDGEAPYNDLKVLGTKVYVRMKSDGSWHEVRP